MSKENVIKSRVLDHITIMLDAENGSEPKVWKLCYDYRAIARIEEAIGKDIKRIEDWKDLSSGKDFPVIVWGGLLRYQPEVTQDEVFDVLNPEAQRLLSDAIFELMFPGAREAFEKALKEKNTSPNVETVTPTA